MKIQCPRCSSQVEISPSLTRSHTVACPSCGSLIRLRSDVETMAETVAPPLSGSDSITLARLVRCTPTPERVGRYQILDTLGRGGMGVVYKALDTELQREVALKVLPGGDAFHAEEVERFVREAQRLAGLSHPNVVQVYDTGRDGGISYYAMELIHGLPLDTWVESVQPDLRTLLATMARVADGVQAAHEIHLLHRDLKPANVLVTDEGVPKVMDFGLAKQLDSRDGLTLSGAVLGTPDHMSPEQAVGRDVDLRSDVFSLGIILYEIITGVRPFYSGNVYVTIERILNEDPVAPRAVCASLPPEVETIILTCLEKKRERRYASAAELGADLRRFLNHEPIHARPVSAVTRARKFIRRHRRLAAVTGAVLLALSLGLLATLWAWVGAEAARTRAEAAEARAQAALQRAAYESYVLRIALAQSRMEDDAFDQANPLIQACPAPLRHWEWGRLQRLSHLHQTTLTGFKDIVGSIAITPDGRELVTTGWGKVAKVLDAATGEARLTLAGHTDLVTRVACAPDGNTVATASRDGTARVWDRKTGKLLATLRGHTAALTSVQFSPDSKRLLTASLDKTARLWDVEEGSLRQTLGPAAAGLTSAAFVPNSTDVVTGSLNGQAILWDVRRAVPRQRFIAHKQALVALAVSADGSHLLTGGYDHGLLLWDLATGKQIRSLHGHRGAVFSVAFSADGTQALTACADRVARLWDLASGRIVRAFHGHEREVFCARFFPDGKRVATGSEDFTLRLWSLHKDRGQLQLPRALGPMQTLRFAPNGTQILVVGKDDTARLLNVRTGAVEQSFKHGKAISAAALSRDGKRLLTGGTDGRVCLWNALSGERISTVPAQGKLEVTALAFAPNGKQCALGLGVRARRPVKDAGTIVICDATTGAPQRTITQVGDSVECLAYVPSGEQLISGSVIYTATGENRGGAVIWDAATGQQIRRLTGPDEHVLDVAVSPDGTHILTAGIDWHVPGRHNDFFVKIWSAATGALVHRLAGHLLAVRAAVWFPDGKRIVSGGIDGRLILWDPGRGREVYRIQNLPRGVNDVAVSADGRDVGVVLGDGAVRIFHAEAWDQAEPKRADSNSAAEEQP